MAERKRSAFFRGNEGMNRTDEELALAKQRAEQRKAQGHQPFRFYVPVGETRRVIVTDDKPDFFMYEHALKDAEGKWGRLFTGCVKTFDNCPVCESSGKESYYALFLSVIDLTPFTLRDGTEVEFSRKLLVVKPAQQKKFLRFYNKEGTLRGAMFDMTRDGDKDSSIGNDIEFVDFVDEDELSTYHRSWKDKDGKKQKEQCDEPYVYEELFEEPTTEKLRAIVGGEPAPGSRRQAEREVGSSRGRSARGRDRDEEDEKPARRGAGHTTRGRARTDEDDWEDDRDGAPFDTDEDEEEKPARRGRSAPATPAAKTSARRGRAAPDEEADTDEEEEEDDKPARGRGRPATPATKTPARRGRAEPEEEDDVEEEKPARRGAARTPAKEEPARPARRAAREEPEDDDQPQSRAAARRARR